MNSTHSNANSNLFERNCNANSNQSKGFWSIWKAFESKFEPFARHSNANSNHSKGIRSIQKGFEAFERIRSIQMQIGTIRKAFECKFEPFERDLKHFNANSNQGFEAFKSKFESFERVLKHSNANSNYSNKTQSIQMKICTLWTRFEWFECNF